MGGVSNVVLPLLLALLPLLAAAETISDTCILDMPDGKKYDISALKRSGKKLNDFYKIEAIANADDTDYYFYLNVCGSLKGQQVPEGAGMVQIEVDNTTKRYTGGYIGSSPDRSDALLNSLRNDDLRYELGTGQDGRETVILMFCRDVGYGAPVFADEPTPKLYYFVWNTCAACLTNSEIWKKCGPEPANTCHFIGGNTNLSTGSILVITIIILFSIYFVLGMLYNRFVMGKTGMEQVPNLGFWEGCCGHIKSGIFFLFSCGGRVGKPPVTYETLPSTGLDIDDTDSEDDDADSDNAIFAS